MFTFGFVENLTWIVMIVCGFVGFLYSGERVLAFLPFWGNTEDKQTKFLKYLDIIMGIVATVWLTLLIADESADFRWLTVALLIAFMIVSFAHPIKDLEGWSIILMAVPFIVIAIVTFWLRNGHEISVGGTKISLWIVLSLVAVVMLLLFLIVFFVEETFVDPILYFLGWAPIVFIVCILVILQGIFLAVNPIDGLLKYI